MYWIPKNGYDILKIVNWVLDIGIGMIPIPNTHTQYTQFLGFKCNFGFGYCARVYTQAQYPNPDFCARMYALDILFAYIL